MAEKEKTDQETVERLMARIDTLEKKLQEEDTKSKKSKKKKKDDNKKDTRFFKESGKLIRGLVDASVEAMKEAANALSSLSDDTDKEKLGEIPAAIVGVLRKTIEIQRKAINKFEESYSKDDEEDED
ncbi:MAG: hypothetical protein KAW12_16400 [Candidatus Aminicenantes bacterium]|nr:hypothetical protein [Candidatus Aminicenantes bacterium]